MDSGRRSSATKGGTSNCCGRCAGGSGRGIASNLSKHAWNACAVIPLLGGVDYALQWAACLPLPLPVCLFCRRSWVRRLVLPHRALLHQGCRHGRLPPLEMPFAAYLTANSDWGGMDNDGRLNCGTMNDRRSSAEKRICSYGHRSANGTKDPDMGD